MKKTSFNYFIFHFFIIFSSAYIRAENKIIYLVSPPRCLSTAFVRMIQARGDFSVFNEPSMCAYSSVHYPDFCKDWYTPDAPKTFDQSHRLIFDEAKNKNVFTKEMIWAVNDYLMENNHILKNPQIHFVFLVRHPHAVICSYYKKSVSSSFFKHEIANSFSKLLGNKDMYDFFNFVKEHAINPPLIICAHDLYDNPRQTLTVFCQRLDIPFKEEAMQWQALGDDFKPSDWHEIKLKDKTDYWHADAVHSTGFAKPGNYEVDKNGYPTFSEIKDDQDRAYCFKAYEENLIYYNLLLAQKEYVLK